MSGASCISLTNLGKLIIQQYAYNCHDIMVLQIKFLKLGCRELCKNMVIMM